MIGKRVVVFRPYKMIATVVNKAPFGWIIRDGHGEYYYAMNPVECKDGKR